jgi:hypothetical protein
MPRFSEPFSVPDPDAQAWDAMVAQNQMLQAGNDPLAGPGDGPPAAPLTSPSEGEAGRVGIEPVARPGAR